MDVQHLSLVSMEAARSGNFSVEAEGPMPIGKLLLEQEIFL